ncbi:hypothetical protein [Massilia sp. 9096]|uniref:hypothetical protein n=1 Tax=Massilia sp. 9096 TaxID=1500894 RepID=UPI000560ED89|nr:hypothetical protein [Massilia sp. 9096]
MNAAATLTLDAPDGRGRRGLSVGWSASLLVHAAIVAWLLHAPAPHPPAAAPDKRIVVRLAPPPAPAAAPAAPMTPARSNAAAEAVQPPARPRTRPTPATPAPATPAPARGRTPAYATRPAPADETPDTNPQPSAQASAPATVSSDAPATPGVDMAGARAAARLIAREDGKSMVALPAHKPVVDPNSGRAPGVDPIEAARKRDCKTAYAGAGLLAIIPLAASAVMDTGCKW